MDNDDFVISVHALDRFEERFPDEWTNEGDVGELIYREAIDALDAGRVASYAPLELAHNDITMWRASDASIVWVQSKRRGYVLVDGYEGLTVATVLVGKTSEEARRKLYGTPKQRRTDASSSNDEAAAAAGVDAPSAQVDAEPPGT